MEPFHAHGLDRHMGVDHYVGPPPLFKAAILMGDLLALAELCAAIGESRSDMPFSYFDEMSLEPFHIQFLNYGLGGLNRMYIQ